MKCVLVAELRDDVAQAVVTAMTAAHFEFGNARRQVQFVVRHQNRLDRDTVEARKRRDSLAATVHVGGGDQQTNILTLMRKASGQAKEFALGNEIDSLRRSNTLNEKSPCVMPGLFVFSAWISQAHDQLYGGHDRGSSFGVVG
ncbi:Aconitase A [Pseudomonas syringae pv. actinidiae]|uniref:Aconitase A n=1 Tax=Pseudomonas syringae pv. actinidiae TaxID=103796 RepID=A0A2V0QCE0_PSESF|nr:Aconitase A [Pseudomonas syringae pv. actinidiae]GBH15442.1 Aconitase A [Pseudomonas syringae pv. actinidiae]